MDEAPLASMYVGENKLLVEIEWELFVLDLPASRFANGRTIEDQTTETLEGILREMCQFHLKKSRGYLPTGSLEIKEHLDPVLNVMVYEAYYSQ